MSPGSVTPVYLILDLTPTSTNMAIGTANPSMECIHPDEDDAQLHLERRPDSPCISATSPKGSSNRASLDQAEHDHIHKSASLPVVSHFLAMRLACFLQMVASVFLLHIAATGVVPTWLLSYMLYCALHWVAER